MICGAHPACIEPSILLAAFLPKTCQQNKPTDDIQFRFSQKRARDLYRFNLPFLELLTAFRLKRFILARQVVKVNEAMLCFVEEVSTIVSKMRDSRSYWPR